MNTTDALRIVRSRGTVPTGYATLGDAADALADEVERLQRQLAAIRTEVIVRHEIEFRQRERYKKSFLGMFEANR
jgi:dynactin complex subunit